ncbi:MAG: argininosuccinate lyase [Chthoniobacter sp.]|jgi:argininosuccinate lyase|nr:argininosuccinate lyase [Chthoniobacter sp.]
MWKGRFQEETSPLLQRYSESISFDWRLWPHDLEGSIAHSAALEAVGLITHEEREKIVAGLREIGAEIAAGQFEFKTELEDIHMNIEAELTRRIGDPGAKLHTARSRNDQVALDLRLYLRAECDAISALLRDLQRALVEKGDRNREVIMPGYTHLQRAQPVYFAHHLLAYVEMFERDLGRLADARKRLNVLPLGSGAIAGSTIVLDRELIARLLDFPAVTQNSMDAVSDRDFAVELLAALALVAMHLSRLSEDVILWASTEFHFVTLSDAYTTGSSLMPQKKNPDAAELTRGKTGRVFGNLIALLTILKGLPMTYNRDMQEDKEPVFDSVDTIKAALEVFAGMLRGVLVNAAACATAVADPMLLATDLADYLVDRGMPFRQAHEIVGRAVALSVERGTPLTQLPLAEYQALSPIFTADVFEVFQLTKAMAARQALGAPSQQNVATQLARWQAALA